MSIFKNSRWTLLMHLMPPCSLMLQHKEYRSRGWSLPMTINHFCNCNSKFCVYVIICEFDKMYVGNTTCPAKTRTLEHKSHIKNKTVEAPLVEHYRGGGGRDNLRCFISLIQCRDDDYSNKYKQLLQAEAYWIHRLRTIKLLGLNQSVNLSCFI